VAIRDEVRQLAEPLAEEEGFELVDVECFVHGRRIVRILLDRPGGIRLEDCARFSRRISDCLDMNQTIQGQYHLEVSSPGIERPLRTLEAMHRFVGQRAAFAAHEPRDGRRNYEGEILAPSEGRTGIRTDDGQEHWFEWAEIKSARLVVDPWARVRQGGGPR
jgi:ribosome maturation factor RimP